MPVVRVSCLPWNLTEDNLRDIHRSIVAGAVSVPEVGVKDEKTMTVLFPPDMMEYGLGSEIIVEVISGTFGEKNLEDDVLKRFSNAMVLAVKKFHPQAMVECFILASRINGFSHSPASEDYDTASRRLQTPAASSPVRRSDDPPLRRGN